MEKYYIYPIYTAILGIILVTIIPRKDIRALAIYGIIFGGIMDSLAIFLIGLFNIGGYINFGPFGFKGFPFFPPIAWSIWFIMFFYILPDNKYIKHIFIFIAACYAVIFSNILANLGILRWNISEIIIPFMIYISWFYTVTWLKLKID